MIAIDRFRNGKAYCGDGNVRDKSRAYEYLRLSSLVMYLLENAYKEEQLTNPASAGNKLGPSVRATLFREGDFWVWKKADRRARSPVGKHLATYED